MGQHVDARGQHAADDEAVGLDGIDDDVGAIAEANQSGLPLNWTPTKG